jgi:hypothetical protein
MPTTQRGFGSFATIGSAVYFSGGGVVPTSATAPALLEVYYGPPVLATTAPTPAPTVAVEPWTTRTAMPLGGCEDLQQSCVGTGGTHLYQYAGNPASNGGEFMKYTAATDAWATGNAPPVARRLSRGPSRAGSYARAPGSRCRRR